ncbi:hypothetical protein [Pseudomonas nitroreducens]|uniref:hypothetical protein n=1 Tax=Pseudomonas nitroreducens TaxID=46680 RepID=UPI002D7FE07F|nr:hypothetical protein [Pseudomonas nitroreducens]
MQVLLDLVTNATMQAWIWGPIMGVVFGALFAGLTSQPSTGAPVTVVQTKNVFVHNINVNKSSASSSEGMGAVLIAATAGLLFIAWKYAVHVDIIHYWLSAALWTILSFSLAIAFVSLLKGQFTSASWLTYLGLPVMFLGGCGYLITAARSFFPAEATQLALQYNFINFYTKALSAYGRSFMISHVVGMMITFVVMMFTGVALLHYLALMNQRSIGVLHGFWVFLTRITLFFSGKSWLVLMGTALIVAYLLIEPWAVPTWITQ